VTDTGAAAESDAALPRAPRSRRGPAKETAYEYVKDLIVNRTLLPGTFVTEMEVADGHAGHPAGAA
jgi:DNA-binding GntR family transcriptional regulator